MLAPDAGVSASGSKGSGSSSGAHGADENRYWQDEIYTTLGESDHARRVGQVGDLFGRWLGRQDSNLRMTVPKTVALPLGDAPTAEARYSGMAVNEKPFRL